MATGRPYPKWLPPAVAEYAAHLSAGRPAQLGFELPLHACVGPLVFVAVPDGSARLHRLTHDPRMAQVWQSLRHEMGRVAKARCHPDGIERAVASWLRGYLLKAAAGNMAAGFLADTPNLKEQRELAERIGCHARKLLGPLDDPCWDRRFTAWNLLDTGAHSARAAPAGVQHLLQELVAATRGRYWSGGDTATFWSLGARPMLAGLPDMLGTLANLADWCIASESFERAPNQTTRFNASVYVRAINHYLVGLAITPRPDGHRAKGFPLHKLIAITANVAFKPSPSLNADFVRRRTSSIAPSI